MDLPRTGIEYARWTIEADASPDGGVSVAFLRRYADRPTSTTPYRTAEWDGPATEHEIADPDGPPRATVTVYRRVLRLLVAGPDASAAELAEAAAVGPAAVVLAEGEHRPWVRWDDVPEDVVRRAGVLRVA